MATIFEVHRPNFPWKSKYIIRRINNPIFRWIYN
jgi:hypothetical protein